MDQLRDTSVCDEGLHTTEIAERSQWFIRTRWKAAGICFMGVVWVHLPPLQQTVKLNIQSHFFLTVGLLLLTSNVIYAAMAQRMAGGQPSKKQLCRFLSIQVLTDFMSLSILSYGLGSVETPVLILFLPHIILSTLFFSRLYSFLMTWIGIFFAVLPMVLEYSGVVATISIFNTAGKTSTIGSNLIITSGYVFAIVAGILVCWYLVSDITSLLLLRKRELEQACDRLKVLDQEKSQITMRATHELKAPFAAIKSYVYTLRDGYCGPLPEKAQQVVQRIGDRCDLLMEKITAIIHLSNLRTVIPANLGLLPTEMLVVVTREVEDAQLIGKPRGIKVHFQSDGGDSVIMASKDHLSTMISNLLRNAIHYSHDGGVIDVVLERREEKVVFQVEDHGIGIPTEHLGKIFTEHFRSNNAVRFNPNGSGMGLALVKEIVRLHNGDIRVTSRLGEGSCFSVIFLAQTVST